MYIYITYSSEYRHYNIGTVYRPFLISLFPRDGRCVRTRKPQKGFVGHWKMAKSDWQRCKEIERSPAVEQKLAFNDSLLGLWYTHLMTCGFFVLISFGCHYVRSMGNTFSILDSHHCFVTKFSSPLILGPTLFTLQ